VARLDEDERDDVVITDAIGGKPRKVFVIYKHLCNWYRGDRVGLDRLHTCVSNSLTQGQTRAGSNRSPDRPRGKGWAKLIFINICSYLVIKN